MRSGAATPGRGSNRGRQLAAFAVLGLAAVLFWFTARRVFFYDSDASTYLELARSLARGEGYSFDGEAHTKFPPGVALLLVPFVSASDGDFVLLYRCSVAIAIAALGCAWWWLRERGERQALLLLFLCAASAAWFEFSTGASLSEAPFALVLLAFFATAERLSKRESLPWHLALTLGSLVLAAMLLRGAGLALLVGGLATCLHLRLRRLPADRAALGDVRLLAVFVPAAVWFVAWTWWSQHTAALEHAGDLGHESSYFALWALQDPHQPDLGSLTTLGLVGRALQKILMESRHVAEVLTNLRWLPREGPSPLLVISIVLCGFGLRGELRRRNPTAAWVTLSYAGLVALWPYDEGRRFVMPFVPALFVLAASGLHGAGLWTRQTPTQRMGRILQAFAVIFGTWSAIAILSDEQALGRAGQLGLLAWILCAIAGIALARRAPRTRTPDLPAWQPRLALLAFLVAYAGLGVLTIRALAAKNLVLAGSPQRQVAAALACEWILANTPRDARILATDYAAIRYATGRSVELLPVSSDRARLAAVVEEKRPDFIVINAPRPGEYFLPTEYERLRVLQEVLADRLQRVARTECGSIWRVGP